MSKEMDRAYTWNDVARRTETVYHNIINDPSDCNNRHKRYAYEHANRFSDFFKTFDRLVDGSVSQFKDMVGLDLIYSVKKYKRQFLCL